MLALASLIHAAQESAFKIPEVLVQQLIKDINTNDRDFRLSDQDLEVLHNNLRYKLEDINGDGAVEFFLYIDHRDWCGAGLNCDYWVYEKEADRYRLLLNDKQVRAKGTKTKGYSDLVSETPMGVIRPDQYKFSTRLYRYDGTRYQEVSSGVEIKLVKKK
jgi:hypothetical protein